MQRNRENSDDEMKTGNLFDDFRARTTTTMPSIFGGRDPFDDPFFTRPFGSISGSGMFNTGGPIGSSSQVSGMKGPVIEELCSEDEGDEEDEGGHDKSAKNEQCEAPNVDCSNEDPIVEHPDDKDNEKQRESISRRTNYNKVEQAEPQSRTFSFQKVTYGGVDGTYYTATTSRRKGNDGALLEESKQADKTTGQASHRISRGLHDRGHSLLRKIGSDGKVDTMQTLHNLEEDELTGFEDAWRGNAERHFPGWSDGSNYFGDAGVGGSRQITQAGRGAINFPFGDNTGESVRMRPNTESKRDQNGGKTKKVVRINIE